MNEKPKSDGALRGMDASDLNKAIHDCAMVLGVLFSTDPEKPIGREAVQGLSSMNLSQDWPFGGDGELAQAQNLIRIGARNPVELREEYNRQFVGPGHFTAPQWASVYLDSDSIVFGNAHLELRRWMRLNGIASFGVAEVREPDDSFGREMILLAWLAEERVDLLREFLNEHVMPWAPRYLGLFQTSVDQPFWRGVALLASSFLDTFSDILDLSPRKRKLFR